MTSSAAWHEAADQLAEALLQENAALAAHDLAGAAALLAHKRAAAMAFEALAAARPSGLSAATIRETATRLERLAEENRALLRRGMEIQGRVLGIVAQAIGAAGGPAASGYGSSGRSAPFPKSGAVSLSAKV